MADALQQVAGVAVTDNGPVGSVQSVSIRGSTSAQVLVLVDGVRLNDSRQGAADLSQIPVENIERIEVCAAAPAPCTERTHWAGWSTSSPRAAPRRPSFSL